MVNFLDLINLSLSKCLLKTWVEIDLHCRTCLDNDDLDWATGPDLTLPEITGYYFPKPGNGKLATLNQQDFLTQEKFYVQV